MPATQQKQSRLSFPVTARRWTCAIVILVTLAKCVQHIVDTRLADNHDLNAIDRKLVYRQQNDDHDVQWH